MKRIDVFTSAILLLIIVINSCSSSSDENSNANDGSENLVKVSKVQYQTEGMQLGNSSNFPFENIVKLNGYVVSPSTGIAQVSAFISGSVSNIYASNGEFVNKGALLCSLSSKEIVTMQQDFAETASKLNRLKQDYQRSKTLIEEKIGSQKDFIAIESEYKSTVAKYEGLKMQLKLMNLNHADVESGNISSHFNLYAPIAGFVTVQNCVLGKYAEPNQVLFEIVNVNTLQLQLSAYEKDISKLKEGQSVRFYTQDANNEAHLAQLVSVGKSIDPDLKTIPCLAKINKEDLTKFVNRMYVEAEIVVDKRNAFAIPSDALIKAGEDYYILTLVKEENEFYYFRKIKVTIGAVSDGFAEIIGQDSLKNIVVKGIYNLKID
jgi:cobalt-zinc-cadmium efflux system membrane fusion protein